MDELTKKITGYMRKEAFCSALGAEPGSLSAPEKLAQGECNVNYLFRRLSDGKKFVFRVNFVSQMHLADQIEYEYRALRAIERSGRTPKPLYADGRAGIGRGVMVYEYLPGRPLDYHRDMQKAAEILADIHSVRIDNEAVRLLSPKAPLTAILEECGQMASHYYDSPLSDADTAAQIRRLMQKGRDMACGELPYTGYQCCVNTELNSGNFLINDGLRESDGTADEDDAGAEGSAGSGSILDVQRAAGAYLIDWEKPVYGDPAQDLGHFLAPTTTFWKTDIILTPEEVSAFTETYIDAVNGRFDTSQIRERLKLFIPITCLRGITWCAMAWVQYQDESNTAPKNADTWKKLCAYLEKAFLDNIEENYLH